MRILFKMHEVYSRIIKGALEELKPGIRIGNIATKLKQLTEEAGYVFSYPCGHICAIDLNEERITPDNDRPLEEGMAVILHPYHHYPKNLQRDLLGTDVPDYKNWI